MEMWVKAPPWRQSPWGRRAAFLRRHRREFWRPLVTTPGAVGGALVSAPWLPLSRPFPSLQRERLKNIERICCLLRKVSVRRLLANAALSVTHSESLLFFEPIWPTLPPRRVGMASQKGLLVLRSWWVGTS